MPSGTEEILNKRTLASSHRTATGRRGTGLLWMGRYGIRFADALSSGRWRAGSL